MVGWWDVVVSWTGHCNVLRRKGDLLCKVGETQSEKRGRRRCKGQLHFESFFTFGIALPSVRFPSLQ